MQSYLKRRCLAWLLVMVGMVGWLSGACLAGPTFNAALSTGMLKHTTPGGVPGAGHTTAYPGGAPINTPATALGQTVITGAGADISRAIGGLGHVTSSGATGFAIPNFPVTMGVSQSDATNSFGANASKVRVDFNLSWNVPMAWNAALVGYQYYVYKWRTMNLNDKVTFSGKADYFVNGSKKGTTNISTTHVNTTGVPQGGNELLFDFDVLSFVNVSAGSTYRVQGHMEMTATDPDGNVSIDLIEHNALDLSTFSIDGIAMTPESQAAAFAVDFHRIRCGGPTIVAVLWRRSVCGYS